MRSHPSRRARRATSAGALVAVSAMLAVGLQAGPATAESAGLAKAEPRAGAMPVKLSPSQRADLLRKADAGKAETADELGLSAKEKLVVRDVVKDADGTTHTRYERTYSGLPVLGGDLVVHRKANGTTKGVTKAAKKVRVADTSAELAASKAEKAALRAAKAEGSKKAEADKAPRKVVWAAQGKPVLAWETVVGGLQHDGTPSELHVISDADTGKELYSYEAVKTGIGNSMYTGQVTIGTAPGYTMTDTGRGDHKTYDLNHGSSGTGTLFTDEDDTWGDGTPANPQTAGVDAHYGAALTWDYYKNVHGRSGIRGDGVGAYSRVHYGNNYVNAFWQDSCFCMTYGDGDGNVKPLTSIDVAAHEMTHGVTAATADLIYSGESGGLNEATSDIFAAAVEFDADNPEDVGDYLVGEKIDIFGTGEPLRYMDEPSKDGRSKDYWYDGLGNVDVHYSSGVANHFFYLLSEGSGAKVINGVSYNSPTWNDLEVTGIGLANAEKIWFRALTTYMTSNTNYAGARTATLQAAADLFGQSSPTYNEVANAWAAVNVGRPIVDGVDLIPPGVQTATVGVADSLQIEATSNTPGPLNYKAVRLPKGLHIDSSTGLISGTPAKSGKANVTVIVTDQAGKKADTTFAWLISKIQGVTFENTDAIAIPDRGDAVDSPVTVSGVKGNAPSELQVAVDITHTWRGDLTIDLVAPSGTVHTLLERESGNSQDDVKETFTVNAFDETANGTWTLQVRDNASFDTGTLNSWKMTF